MCTDCVAPSTKPKLSAITRVRRVGRSLPAVVDKIFGVPLKNREFDNIMQGAFKTRKSGRVLEHALLYKGDIDKLAPDTEVLIRINSSCFTGDIFHDESCDCNWQLWESLRMLEKWDGVGVVVYHFADEGKAHGYLEKLRAYDPESGMYPVEGDRRDFTHAVAILKALGITRVRLMTNNPQKRETLEKFGFTVTGTEHVVSKDPALRKFLDWKATHLGHEMATDVAESREGK